MNAAQTPRVLFLHGGPGLTAELERQRFGASLPVHWWDQPRVNSGTERALETLIDSAAAEVTRLSIDQDGAVQLLVNSFGAYLARALVDRVSERIGAITICGGLWDLGTAILRLAWRFAERDADADLEAACRKAATDDTPEQYLVLLARVAARSDFLDCYWGPTAIEPREAMKTLAAQGRLIDWPTYQAGIAEALAMPQVPLTSPHPGGVRILLGRFDPYFEESDIGAWKALWPAATVEIVEAGHFPHLELPSAAWMPS